MDGWIVGWMDDGVWLVNRFIAWLDDGTDGCLRGWVF